MPKPTPASNLGRMAAVNVQLPFGRVLPAADGDIDPFDRMHNSFSYTSQSVASIYVEPHRMLYWNGPPHIRQSPMRYIPIYDGVPAPTEAVAGYALLFIDTADGDLKVLYSDGTTKTIVTDT